MRKYIIFLARGKDPQWRERKLQPSGSLTWTIAEHWDSSDAPLPEPGYRPPEFLKLDDSDPLGGKTHYRPSDWEVASVEVYTPELPASELGTIALCYCEYSPIESSLQPLPERQISLDSFGDDKEAYQAWLRK